MAQLAQDSSRPLSRMLQISTDVVRNDASWLRIAYFAVLGCCLALLTIGSTMSMGFSVIDDHERLRWLGPRGDLSISSLPAILLSTEVGYVATPCVDDRRCTKGRFRPVYYSFIIAETWLFGDTPAPYYALRVAFFAFFLAAIGWASEFALGLWAATGLLLYVSSMQFWAGFWDYSLGSGEQVAIVGFTLAIIGLATIVRRWYEDASTKVDGALSLVGVGSFIALGSKENFVFLFGIFLVCLAYSMRSRRLSRMGLIVNVILLGACLAIIVGGLVAFSLMAKLGGDMKGVTVWNRLGMFWRSWRIAFPISIVMLGALMLFAARSPLAVSRLRASRSLWCAGIVAIVSGVYSLWESFFYGAFGGGGTARYAFPGLLIVPFGLGLLLYLIRLYQQAIREAPAARLALNIGAFLLIAVWPGHAWTFPIRAHVASRVEQTTRISTDFARAAEVARAHPEWPLLVDVAAVPYDKEPVDTLDVWLHRYEIGNRTLLRIRRLNPQQQYTPFEERLLTVMERWTTEGAPGKYHRPEQRDRDAIARGECYVISIRLPSDTACTPLPLHPETYW